ncbi:MAG: hypothetical protein MUF55_03035 [Hydrogenophaga sp.]|jgi:hypothetical protein|nr:hypothetical protein [Hydrogenophaga sp.]
MRAVKKARKLIEANPTNSTAETLSRLVLALESETPFQLADLYKLGYADFELALAVIAEWRLDRYYTSKAVLLDLSMQVEQGKVQAATEPPAATAKA